MEKSEATWMRRGGWRVAACAVALAIPCGCAEKPLEEPASPGEKPVLRIYTWSDYVKPELIQRFERENHCTVAIDTYDSNEAMYDHLKSRERGSYDLLFPSSYMVKILHDQDLLRKLNPGWIPNLRNIDSAYLAMAFDQEMDHSVPYAMGITCLGYRGSQVKGFAPSWGMLDRADLAGRMSMLDDYRETIGAALKFLGYSLNSTNDQELAQAKAVVLRWKKNLAGFDNEQYKEDLASGASLVVHGYGGDLMQARPGNPDIQIAVPREGAALSFDDMVIPADASQVELAHAFINFILDPHVAAELTEFICFLCPNEVSYQYLSAETRANPLLLPPPEMAEKLEMIADLGKSTAKYEKLWQEIQDSP
ncbi:MAG: spermidine/putrescine ABC transporter substrate-binding protein [Opitutae bacterium]|nr:spermidine/putrescine ABC transporter substrate-binding protein [Opitutae bacterium]